MSGKQGHTASNRGVGRMNVVVCPRCARENPGSDLHCSQCGASLEGIERTEVNRKYRAADSTTNVPAATPAATPAGGEFIHSTIPASQLQANPPQKPLVHLRAKSPKEPATRSKPAFAAGICLLVLLMASIYFQSLHPASRLIFVVGIIIGFGLSLIKTYPNLWKDFKNGGNFTQSSFPQWLSASILFLLALIGVIAYFGAAPILEWLLKDNPGERVLVLIFGCVFGVAIEFTSNYLLDTIKHYRLAK